MNENHNPNKSRFSDSLISLASSDLKSSRLLFKNGIYHNSLFALQQSVEKLVKAVGLDLGIIGTEKMTKISHRPHRVYKTAVDKTSAEIVELDKAPEIKKILTNLEGYKTYVDRLKTMSSFFEDQHKYDFEYLDEEELSELLGVLYYAADDSQSLQIDHKECCKLLFEIFSMGSNWNPTEDELKNFELKMKPVLDIEAELSRINAIMMWLALITQKHQDAVRYPCQCCGESPIVNYNLETPIIKYFGNIFNLQLHCLTKYSEIRLRMEQIKTTSNEEE